jgi:ATP-dependent Clp protease, protease subunit
MKPRGQREVSVGELVDIGVVVGYESIGVRTKLICCCHTRGHGSVRPMSDTTRPQALDAGFDPRSDVFNRLLKNRVVMLGTDVNDDIANQICAQLLYLEGEEADADIWLYINSPGGSVTAGMAIYDTMQFVSCDVATVCMGMAASMGQFLLTAGAAGKRYTLPNARIMMHQPLAGLRGQATDIAIQAEQLAYTKRRMAELTAHHSGQTLEQIQADSERDRWFTADAAKAYGLVDAVKTKRGELA